MTWIANPDDPLRESHRGAMRNAARGFSLGLRWLLLGLSLVSVTSCSEFNPFHPVGEAERFTPPPQYRIWYNVMERCTGRTGDFDLIQWWIADSLAGPPDTQWIGGTWSKGHIIWLRRWTGYDATEDSIRTVLHEMIHDLIETVDHPHPPFGVCDDPVLVEGPAPSPTTRRAASWSSTGGTSQRRWRLSTASTIRTGRQ